MCHFAATVYECGHAIPAGGQALLCPWAEAKGSECPDFLKAPLPVDGGSAAVEGVCMLCREKPDSKTKALLKKYPFNSLEFLKDKKRK